MFSKKIAGVGVAAAVVGSALIPSVAFAEDANSDGVAPGSVAIEKTVVGNSLINNSNDEFTFTFTANACSEDGCVSSGIPTIDAQKVTPGSGTNSVSDFMPAISEYSVPGIYQWTVKEAQTVSPNTNQSEIDFSKAEYRVKAYIVKNTSGNLEYKAVTIVKDKDDSGANVDLVDGKKAKSTKIEFTNTYTTLSDNFTVTKQVVNNAGLGEADNYELEVIFTWPSNIASDPHIGVWRVYDPVGDPPVVGRSFDTSVCSVAAKVTTCTVTINKDQTLEFGNVPVGATWTISETIPGDAKFTPTYSASNGTVADDVENAVTVTNTYDNITPTGIALAVLPYVLMIGIPLLAIAGYIALRRKMNL